jgi:hypothetical protein
VGTARLIDNVAIPARVADAETDGER